jgi:hypothetical protein
VQLFKRRRLRLIGEIHKLLSVLSDHRMVCSGSRRRAISRLFLDSAKERAIPHAERLGLVTTKFLNPYIIGRGERFISMTRLGAEMTGVPFYGDRK